MTELERYQQWCEQAPLDEAGRAALAAMQNDETERKGCFGAELQFGTAGIRGIMGIGTNRLNDFTVRRTAQGLAAWLTSTELPQRCAIGLPPQLPPLCGAVRRSPRGARRACLCLS